MSGSIGSAQQLIEKAVVAGEEKPVANFALPLGLEIRRESKCNERGRPAFGKAQDRVHKCQSLAFRIASEISCVDADFHSERLTV